MASPVMRNINQAAGQAAGEAGDRAVAAAMQERSAANQARAANSDIVREAKGFSLGRSFDSAWGTFSNLMFIAPMLSGVVGWIGKRKMLSGASGAIGKTAGAMTLPNATFGELATKVGEVFGEHHGEKVQKHGTKLVEYAKNTRIGQSSFGQRAMASLKEAQVANTVLNVGFALQETISVGMSISEKSRTIRQMQKDLTGKADGPIDPMLKQLQQKSRSGKQLLSYGLRISGALGNMYLALFDKSSGLAGMGKMLGVGMGTNLAANMLTAGDTALQSYRDMHLSMAQTGKADVALYEGLIGGLAQNAPSKLVSQIAQKAYEQQLAPADVLKMVKETDWLKKPGAPDAIKNVNPPKSFVAAENARRAANDPNYKQRQIA